MQVGYIFNWDLEVDSQSFSIIISSYYKSSIWIFRDKSDKSVAWFYLPISEVIRSGVTSLNYFVFLADFNVLVFGCIHKQVVTYINNEVPLKTYSKSKRSCSPTVTGIWLGRGLTLHTGDGGRTAMTVAVSASASKTKVLSLMISISKK